MADYKASSITGTSFQRAFEVQIKNPIVGSKAISFQEERVINTAEGTVVAPVSNLFYGLQREFTPENASTAFPLLDVNGEPTGSTATYMQVYLMLMSLYYALATERDNQEAP